MVAKTYDAFVTRMIQRYEGGYGWHRADPGGPTKFGITCFALAEHRGQKMHDMNAWAPIVKAMGMPEALAIYRKRYAIPVRYDALPAGIDVVIFDYGVNSGPARGIRVARRLLGMSESATLTDEVIAKLAKVDAKKFINDMCDERLRFMKSIRGGSAWAVYGKGWSTRVADLRKYALALVSAKPITKVDVAEAGGIASAPAVAAAAGFDWTIVMYVGIAAALLIFAFAVWRSRKAAPLPSVGHDLTDATNPLNMLAAGEQPPLVVAPPTFSAEVSLLPITAKGGDDVS